jgi:phosphoglycerate dehydrogenase-like enzyme
MSKLALLPFGPDEVPPPPGVRTVVWTGVGELPDVATAASFYVPPYLGGRRVLEVMNRLSSLEVVQTLTAGYDDVLPLLPAGVTLCNARGVHDASTAELAVGLMLAALRGIPDAVRAQDRGEWEHRFRPSLADRTVLIVGYGSIGAAVERRLAGFEVDVLRVASRPRTTEAGPVHGLDELPRLLPRADVVVLLVPLTEATRGLVDAAFLAALPDGALLVNVARGPVVDTDALLAELRSGRITAALDVTDPEPLPSGHPLWHAPGALITAHVGGDSTAFHPRAVRLVREQLDRWASGQPLEHVVARD